MPTSDDAADGGQQQDALKSGHSALLGKLAGIWLKRGCASDDHLLSRNRRGRSDVRSGPIVWELRCKTLLLEDVPLVGLGDEDQPMMKVMSATTIGYQRPK